MDAALPDGEEGHVALKAPSPQLMLGYWKDPERTAACYVDGPDGRWYLSGDRGTRDAEGWFWYAGRADDVINSAGYRIGPLEVENALLEHPSVQECAVVASPDPDRGEIVKAFVVLKEGCQRHRPRSPRSCRTTSRTSPRPTNIRAPSSSSPTCRRPSPARSAAAPCATWSSSAPIEA